MSVLGEGGLKSHPCDSVAHPVEDTVMNKRPLL